MTSEVILALSELRALVGKAARGAGLSWGMAEEAGWAAEWLARRGMPAADWATLWLDACVNGSVGPVEVGVALADMLAFGDLPFAPWPIPDGLAAPGYLLPFLHLVATRHGAVDIRSPSGTVARILAEGEVRFGPNWGGPCRDWQVVAASTPSRVTRPTVAHSVIDCLEGLALRTTVPPSDHSRQDAGSTAGDND